MKREPRKLALRREVVRTLRPADLRVVVGGMHATTSEDEGAGPCPGQYTYMCRP